MSNPTEVYILRRVHDNEPDVILGVFTDRSTALVELYEAVSASNSEDDDLRLDTEVVK